MKLNQHILPAGAALAMVVSVVAGPVARADTLADIQAKGKPCLRGEPRPSRVLVHR